MSSYSGVSSPSFLFALLTALSAIRALDNPNKAVGTDHFTRSTLDFLSQSTVATPSMNATISEQFLIHSSFHKVRRVLSLSVRFELSIDCQLAHMLKYFKK